MSEHDAVQWIIIGILAVMVSVLAVHADYHKHKK